MSTGSIHSSEDGKSSDDSNWQQVPTKRKNDGSPNIFRQKRPHNEEVPSTSNRYEVLAIDDEENNNFNEPSTSIPKPPPIFIPNVENIGKMVTSINKTISNVDYHYKSLRDGQVRLVVNNVDAYRKLIRHLDTNNIIYHTSQLKQERAFE